VLGEQPAAGVKPEMHMGGVPPRLIQPLLQAVLHGQAELHSAGPPPDYCNTQGGLGGDDTCREGRPAGGEGVNGLHGGCMLAAAGDVLQKEKRGDVKTPKNPEKMPADTHSLQQRKDESRRPEKTQLSYSRKTRDGPRFG
jgi:hypothetical protein